jgi:hypothetical protein
VSAAADGAGAAQGCELASIAAGTGSRAASRIAACFILTRENQIYEVKFASEFFNFAMF